MKREAWTHWRKTILTVRHDWGSVWVEAWCEEGAVEWRIEAMAIANDARELAGPRNGWQETTSSGRGNARRAMLALAGRLDAHIRKAQGVAS